MARRPVRIRSISRSITRSIESSVRRARHDTMMERREMAAEEARASVTDPGFEVTDDDIQKIADAIDAAFQDYMENPGRIESVDVTINKEG